MKRMLARAGLVAAVLLTGCSDGNGSGQDPADRGAAVADLGADAVTAPPDDPARPLALAELFTSEGCSSCPKAEQTFGMLVADARKGKLRVFMVAWHVDYWNKLGWPDPFSSAEATTRQKAYAKAWGKTQIYTPQLVVNGDTEVRPASSLTLAADAITAALARPVKVSTTLWLAQKPAPGASKLTVNYRVKGAPAGARLSVLLVERSLWAKPTAGENAGKTLSHANSVRAHATATDASGKVTLTLPTKPPVKLQNCSLIGMVQDSGLKVVGATGVAL